MSVRSWFAVWICVIIGISGCIKTAEIVFVPSAETPKTAQIDLAEAPDSEPLPEYQGSLPAVDAADWTEPLLYLTIAASFDAAGDEEKAIQFLDKSGEAYAGRGDLSGQALAFSRKVLFLFNAGRDREARDLMREAGNTWRMPPLSAFPYYLEGRDALIQGDIDHAREFLQRALRDNTDYMADPHLLWLRRDTELAAGMAAVLVAHLPRLLAAYRQPEAPTTDEEPAREGGALLRNALVLNQALRQTQIGWFIPADDYQRCEAEVEAFLGLDAGIRQNGQEAIRHLTSAAEISRQSGFREGEIRSLLFLGELGLGGENSREGLEAAELLCEIADRYRAAAYRIWSRLLIARYGIRQGQRENAIAVLREAEDIVSVNDSAVDAEMFVRICRSQRQAVYQLLVELMAAEGRDDEALSAAEKAKAVMMADLLSGQDIGGGPPGREMLRRIKECGEAIRTAQRRILRAHSDALTDKLLVQLTGVEEAYRELLDRLGEEDDSLRSLVSPRDIDIPSLLDLLDGNTTLFDYFVTDRSLYVWAIHRSRIHLERIDLSRDELRQLVLSFLEAIHAKNRKRTDTLSRRVYDLLLKPIIPFVSGERIGFITDDCLAYLPFAAMNYRGKFLVEGFSIFHLPAAAVLAEVMTRRTQPSLRILAFGDPDLEDETLDLHRAVQEIEMIRKRIGSTTVLLRRQASETKAEEMMTGYDVLHFAVRGQFDPDEPLRSGLLLTPDSGEDGILSALDIFRLRYSGRAVVLSGCDTIPEKDPEGNSFSVLQRAFLFAGSPSVISSLWLVEDRMASHLLELFYQQLVKRTSLADSVRTAQLHLLREGYPPYVWAAFVLTGRY